jgi:hypothetical protein
MRWLSVVPAFALWLSGCATWRDISNGEPALPGPIMLTPDSQAIVQAANVPLAPGAPPPVPLNCQAVIQFEDRYPVPPSGVIVQDSKDPKNSITVSIDNYVTLRNNCISEFIGAIDNQYREYRIELVHLSGGLTAFADTATAVLSAAAAGVGGSTAQVLSGIAAAIAGGKSAINTDVLRSNSILAVIAQMDADRNEQNSIILQQENGTGITTTTITTSGNAQQGGTASQTPSVVPRYTILDGTITKHITVQYPASGNIPARQVKIDGTETFGAPDKSAAPAAAKTKTAATTPQLPAYTMHKAAIDLAAYYAAGTFAHALVSLQQQSGAKAANCKTQVNSIKTTGAKTGGSTTTDPAGADAPSPTTSAGASTPSGC